MSRWSIALPLAAALAAGAPSPAAGQTTPAPPPPTTTPPTTTPATPIVLSGQVRLRSEWDDRHVTADERVLVHLLRTRLRVTARPLERVTVVAELQDARHLGSGDPAQGRGTSDASAEGLDMHQAFAQVSRPLELPVDLRFGRQEISLANERLVGVSNWSNTGRAFDGARATVRPARTLAVDVWSARLSSAEPGPTESQSFHGAWAAWKPSPRASADAFALRDDNTDRIRRGADEGRGVLARWTLGGTLRGAAGRFDAELEGARQTGRAAPNDSSARRDVRAFLASATVGVSLPGRWRPRLGVLSTVLSGDGDPADGRDERFSTLFGTNHRFYGTADIVPELSGAFGLVDHGATLSAAPTPRLRLLLEGHELRPHRGADGRFGREVDLTATWRAAPPFEVSGGASLFRPGALLRDRLGGSTRTWAYVAGLWEI